MCTKRVSLTTLATKAECPPKCEELEAHIVDTAAVDKVQLEVS